MVIVASAAAVISTIRAETIGAGASADAVISVTVAASADAVTLVDVILVDVADVASAR